MEFDMTVLFILAALVLLTSVTLMTTISALTTTMQRQHRRVDRKLNLIMEHLGINPSDPELARVEELAMQGKKIPAIKLHREVTGSSLKEAKDAVERMIA